MENWIMDIMEQFGYFGIFLLILLENIFPIIPSEIILSFGGFMTTYTDLSIFGVILFSTMGSVAGAIVLYMIGLFINKSILENIINKSGNLIGLSIKDIKKANTWFSKYGKFTVFFCRFIPLIRSLISLPAGMNRMNFGSFLFLTTIGTSLWNIIIINLGASVGKSWKNALKYINMYSEVIYILLILVSIITIVVLIIKKKKRDSI